MVRVNGRNKKEKGKNTERDENADAGENAEEIKRLGGDGYERTRNPNKTLTRQKDLRWRRMVSLNASLLTFLLNLLLQNQCLYHSLLCIC